MSELTIIKASVVDGNPPSFMQIAFSPTVSNPGPVFLAFAKYMSNKGVSLIFECEQMTDRELGEWVRENVPSRIKGK